MRPVATICSQRTPRSEAVGLGVAEGGDEIGAQRQELEAGVSDHDQVPIAGSDAAQHDAAALLDKVLGGHGQHLDVGVEPPGLGGPLPYQAVRYDRQGLHTEADAAGLDSRSDCGEGLAAANGEAEQRTRALEDLPDRALLVGGQVAVAQE